MTLEALIILLLQLPMYEYADYNLIQLAVYPEQY